MMNIRIFICISLAAVLCASSAFGFTDYSAELDFETIRSRYHAGRISREDYLVSSLKAAFKPRDPVSQSKSSAVDQKTGRNLTLLLKRAVTAYDTLSPEAREVVDRVLMRPTDTDNEFPWDGTPLFYLPDPVSTYEPSTGVLAGKYKFWYVLHDTPDSAGHIHKTTLSFRDQVVAAFETTYTREVTDLGYPEPPPDTLAADNGGDGLIDVYIMNCGAYLVYGYTSSTTSSGSSSAPSFMVVDNDFEEFATIYVSSTEAMQVTVAHEFHHAIQYRMNFYSDEWISEASSTWMESQVYPDIQDNIRNYLNGSGGFFSIPGSSIDSEAQLYSAWIFLEYMTILWGEPDVVLAIWEELESINSGVTAISRVTGDYGSNLKTTFSGFARKNYSQSDFYPDASDYDEVAVANAPGKTLDFSTDQSHIFDIPNISLSHLAATYYKFIPGLAGGEDGDSLMVQVDGADGASVTAAVTVKNLDNSYTTYPISLDSYNQGYVTLDSFNQASAREAVLVLSNGSPSSSSTFRIYGGLDVSPSSDLGGGDTQSILVSTDDSSGGCFISGSLP